MRSIVLYGIMVGLPILGTSAVLDLGRHLSAFPPVQGDWEVAWSEGPPGSCSSELSRPKVISIVQSGPVLTLSLGDSGGRPLSGQLHGSLGNTFAIQLSRAATNREITEVRASLSMSGDVQTLQGAVSRSACEGAPSETFTATRHRAAQGSASH